MSDVRARLHQASESTLRQLCNDASNTVLIENNGVVPFWNDSIFSMTAVLLVVAALTLTLSVNGLSGSNMW